MAAMLLLNVFFVNGSNQENMRHGQSLNKAYLKVEQKQNKLVKNRAFLMLPPFFFVPYELWGRNFSFMASCR